MRFASDIRGDDDALAVPWGVGVSVYVAVDRHPIDARGAEWEQEFAKHTAAGSPVARCV